ncbi:MAG: hypothetical protein KGN74_05505 [Gemmatimonadota bacterium]|nr:hypothetical protein [Gemmatimonadota bacterium]
MLDRIVVRGVGLSALAATAALLTAATRTTRGPHGAVAPLAGGDAAVVGTATLKVRNDALTRRVVYVTMDGKRQRLGVANAGATTDFTVPRSYVAGRPSVRFMTDPYGGAPLDESQRMHVIARDTLQMVILPGR